VFLAGEESSLAGPLLRGKTTRTSESRAVGDKRDATALALAVGPSQRGADGRAKRMDD